MTNKFNISYERLSIIRNSLGEAILNAKVDANKNTKDLTVLEYWYTCFLLDEDNTLKRIYKLDVENAIDIIRYIDKLK